MAIITQNRRIAYFYLGLLNRRKREKNVEILNENKTIFIIARTIKSTIIS